MSHPCTEEYVVDKGSSGPKQEPLEAGREQGNQWFNASFYFKRLRPTEGMSLAEVPQ